MKNLLVIGIIIGIVVLSIRGCSGGELSGTWVLDRSATKAAHRSAFNQMSAEAFRGEDPFVQAFTRSSLGAVMDASLDARIDEWELHITLNSDGTLQFEEQTVMYIADTSGSWTASESDPLRGRLYLDGQHAFDAVRVDGELYLFLEGFGEYPIAVLRKAWPGETLINPVG